MAPVPNGPDAWIPATIDNINGTTLTFSAGSKLHVRVFDTPLDALDALRRVGPNFTYSPERNQLRSGETGKIVALPAPSAAGAPADHTGCQLVASGHRPHWIPVMRAINSREDGGWKAVEVLQVEGTKVTFAIDGGVVQGWFHNPQLLMAATRYHPKWHVLQAASGAVAVLAHEAIGACRA